MADLPTPVPSANSDSDAPPPARTAEVLNGWAIYSDAPHAFYKNFMDEALAHLRKRKTTVDRLTSAQDWKSYRDQTRRKFAELLGPFPEKKPLNARVLGVVQKSGFRLEKIVYESQPGFHVSAALFIPDGLTGKAPAILYCSGHSASAFRSSYQTTILNLVKKGFIVLAFDPIGQGERLQYVDRATGKPAFGQPAPEHTHVGIQSFLVGDNLARHMIWDGIRSIDYLISRPEVDATRLGINGRSGGGTQSAYIAAADDRILASAPENYLTTFEQLLRTRGPQDPEQIFPAGLAEGFDQTDLLLVRAPKPTLIVATTRDMFSIDGTQSLFAEARRAYAALGSADALQMAVDDAEHASTRQNREATYAFFQRTLNLPGDPTDERVERLSPADLRITETGQVATSFPDGDNLPAMNRRQGELLARQLDQQRQDLSAHLRAVKTAAARLAGYTPSAGRSQPAMFSGRFAHDDYSLEKYLLPVDDRYAIPLLALVPAKPSGKIVIYLHPDGKAAAAGAGGELEWLVKQGCTVIAPDLIGMGELGGGIMSKAVLPPRLWSAYVLLGKSMLGRQLADLDRTVEFARARFGATPENTFGLARGTSGPLLLHGAALTDSFSRVALIGSPLSYRAMVQESKLPPTFVSTTVPAALTAYDLPDLAAALSPRRLLLADARNGADAPADENASGDTSAITRAYEQTSHAAQLQVLRGNDPAAITSALEQWLR